MNRRRNLLALVAAAWIIAGCSGHNPFEAQTHEVSLNNDTPLSLAKKGKKQVYINGRFATTFQFNPLVCLDPARGTPVDCGAPGAVPVVVATPFQGAGVISPLGDFTVATSQTVDFSATPPSLYGTSEYTAANGDKLYAAHKGITSVPDPAGNVTYSGAFKFTGGTGMFSHVRGAATFTGGANLANMTGYFLFRGMLKYKKSGHDRDDDDGDD